MELSIIYELRDHNVAEKDIEIIMGRVKNRLCEENLDIELERLNYKKIFTVDYNTEDSSDDFYENKDTKLKSFKLSKGE